MANLIEKPRQNPLTLPTPVETLMKSPHGNRALIAGSFALAQALGRRESFIPNDLDIFINAEDLYSAELEFQTAGWVASSWTDFAVTYEFEKTDEFIFHSNQSDDFKVQLIPIPRFRGAEHTAQLFERFDLNVVQVALVGRQLLMTMEAYLGIQSRTVSLNAVKFPLWTGLRLVKYAKRGFDVDAALMKLLTDVSGSGLIEGQSETTSEGYAFANLLSVFGTDDLTEKKQITGLI